MNILETITIKDFKLFGITLFSVEESKTSTLEHVEHPIEVTQEYYNAEFEV